jgi:enediyne polyketide synthase
MMTDAAEALRSTALLSKTAGTLSARLFSSRNGEEVKAGVELGEHFAEQALGTVDFQALVERMGTECDQLIEVGPGRVLSGLADTILGETGACLPVAGQPERDIDLNAVLARAFVLGVSVRWGVLYEGRLVRPFVPADQRKFIDNPCEREMQVPEVEPLELGLASVTAPRQVKKVKVRKEEVAAKEESVGVLGLLLDLAVKRTGFPRESITPDRRLLDDLNLDSIKAAELVAGAAKEVGLAGQIDPSQFANATLAEVAAAIEALRPADGKPVAAPAAAAAPAGEPTAQEGRPSPAVLPAPAAPLWVRAFTIEYVRS